MTTSILNDEDREKAAEQLANELRIPVLDPKDEQDLLDDPIVLGNKSLNMGFLDPVLIPSLTGELLKQSRWRGRESEAEAYAKRLAEELRETFLTALGGGDPDDDDDEVDDDGLLAGQYPVSHRLFMTAVRLRNAGHNDSSILQTLKANQPVTTEAVNSDPLNW